MADQRERILDCACRLCLDEGLDGFSMRRLARAVGVTAPALYRHYGSKEEVLLEVVNEAYRLHMEYLSRALEGGTALERFRMAGAAYLDFALEQPRYYELMYSYAEALGLETIPDETLARARAVGHFWRDRVREVMAAGHLKEGDPDQVSTTLWSLAHGVISLYLQGLLPLDEEAFRTFTHLAFLRLLTGLATGDYHEELEMELRESGAEQALVGALDPEVVARSRTTWGGSHDGGSTEDSESTATTEPPRELETSREGDS